jgi:energy-coupling factor transport system ATP-binding protein
LRPLDLAGLSEVEGSPQRMNGAVWTIKNVSFAYKHEPETLHITETSFPSGSATAIIGHNGAGKSTFARCLCGLEKHFKGTVQDQSKNYSRKERLKLCYMVMQDVNHQLFTESVLDEILLSMRTENKQRARKILQEMDLLPYEDCHPMGLSGGQKQRVAVASAIASERPLILFDEPTSGLDLFHMRQVANVVNQVANAGRTALVVTHDPEFILRCCNYVLHLENGQIQESYSIEDSNGQKRLLKFFLSDMKKEVSTE